MARKGQYKDLTGRRFGRLVVVSLLKIVKGQGAIWNCLCDCGNTKQVARGHLLNGDTRSCGCYHDERSRDWMKQLRPTQVKENHPNWIGGKYRSKEGYIYCIAKDHPHAVDNGYVLEHRLVMERHLGRYLKPDEIVHHIDRRKDNNNLSNLILFANHSEHAKHHNLGKAFSQPGCELIEQ